VELSGRDVLKEAKFKTILNALATYRDLNGHVNVPQSFVVPDSDKWPEESRGG
jgi:hypothetical protein